MKPLYKLGAIIGLFTLSLGIGISISHAYTGYSRDGNYINLTVETADLEGCDPDCTKFYIRANDGETEYIVDQVFTGAQTIANLYIPIVDPSLENVSITVELTGDGGIGDEYDSIQLELLETDWYTYKQASQNAVWSLKDVFISLF